MPRTRTSRWRVVAAAAALLVPQSTSAATSRATAASVPAGEAATEVVYAADADGDGVYGILLRDLLTGRTTTVLPPDPTREWLYDDPELSPTGDRIALSTDRGAARYDEGIAVVRRDGRGLRRLTTPPPAVGTTYTIDVGPAWSPDGSRLLFTRITTDTANAADVRASTGLWTVPAAGGAAVPVPGTAGGYLGDWSPDGRSVVFAVLAAGADSGPLTVVGLDGSGRRTLGGAVGLMPSWSPDGSTVAFATITARDGDRVRQRDVAQIATVPAAGGPVRVLRATRPTSAPTVAGSPSWSPDGESIVYDLFGHSATDAFPPGDLWTVDRAGTRAGRLVATAGDEAQGHVHGPRPEAVRSGAPSTFTPVTPRRVLDTRSGTGGRRGALGPGGALDLRLVGLTTAAGAVPAAVVPRSASAVVLTLTATGGTASTDLRVSPSGGSPPPGGAVTAPRGATVPGTVTVRLGADGAVTVHNRTGQVHAVGDLVGFYTPDARGLGVASVPPARVLDTHTPAVGARAGRLGPRGVLDLRVVGRLPTADGTVTVPPDARAVVLSVTALAPTAATDVRASPTPTGAGRVALGSSLVLRAGQAGTGLVIVPVGRDGRVRLRNTAGTVHLAADLAGWYARSAPGRYVPVDPVRLLDTRTGTGGPATPATAGGRLDVRVAGARGVPQQATAAVLVLTGTAATSSTDVRAYPTGLARVPRTSSLHLGRAETRAAPVLVRLGPDGRVRVRNGAGRVQLRAELTGYVVG